MPSTQNTRVRQKSANPRSNVPTKPGLYYYRMNGGGVWHHQEVIRLPYAIWRGHKKGTLVVNNGEGFVPVARMHRHWLSAGRVPGGRK